MSERECRHIFGAGVELEEPAITDFKCLRCGCIIV